MTITPRTPLHFIPEEHGLSSILLKKIDAIALDGIQQGAYPGCQIVVLRNGHIMYDKAFGTYAGKGSPRVESTDIYDLASLSKTTGTLLAIMKLYDKGRFSLTDKISDYLPFLQRTDKKDITIQEILLHQSGLPSWIPFYQEVIDKDSYDGRLFSARRMRNICYGLVRLHGRIRILSLKKNISRLSGPGIIPFKSVIVYG
ncbi:hypothetical protein BFINE_17420 [Bacteroides finegoldii DSM 17565]|nr:hypothetical protein BFINE_17420 [Bacteroides finegoldii DSM 17565]